MPQKGSKVLSLNQKAQICEASLAPGFDKEHCIKRLSSNTVTENEYGTFACL